MSEIQAGRLKVGDRVIDVNGELTEDRGEWTVAVITTVDDQAIMVDFVRHETLFMLVDDTVEIHPDSPT